MSPKPVLIASALAFPKSDAVERRRERLVGPLLFVVILASAIFSLRSSINRPKPALSGVEKHEKTGTVPGTRGKGLMRGLLTCCEMFASD